MVAATMVGPRSPILWWAIFGRCSSGPMNVAAPLVPYNTTLLR